MKKTVSIMAHKDGRDLPALTLIAGNPDFPISDLNQLAEIFTAGFNGLPAPRQLDATGSYIHFAQAENGVQLDSSYKLRFRTANSGITAEEGIIIAVNKSLPVSLQTEIHERFGKVMRAALDAISMGPKHGGMNMTGPALTPQF